MSLRGFALSRFIQTKIKLSCISVMDWTENYFNITEIAYYCVYTARPIVLYFVG